MTVLYVLCVAVGECYINVQKERSREFPVDHSVYEKTTAEQLVAFFRQNNLYFPAGRFN
jgi:hypothetical protein